MTSTVIFSSIVINCSVLQGLFALVNRLAVQLGLNSNTHEQLSTLHRVLRFAETTQGIISALHRSRSCGVTSSWDPSSLHILPRSRPTFLRPAKCSFRSGTHRHPPHCIPTAGSPLERGSVQFP